MKKDNKGFSLVELIVVITIMVVLTGLISRGVSMAVSKPADECAEKLKASLQSMRITTMGKFDAHLEIYKKNDQIYVKEIRVEDSSGTTTTKESIVSGKGVKLYYEKDNSGSYTELTDGNILYIYYNRSSGAFAKTAGYYCTHMKAEKGNKTAVLRLYPLTGKIERE